MPKALCIFGMATAVLIILLFGLNLGSGILVKGYTWKMDVPMLLGGLFLGVLSWLTFREQV